MFSSSRSSTPSLFLLLVQLTLEVSEKGLTSVRLSIDIVDENQAPSFLSKEYVFMVAEDTPAMTVLATVEVIEGPEVDSQTADTDTILVRDQDTFTDAFRFKQLVVTGEYPGSRADVWPLLRGRST